MNQDMRNIEPMDDEINLWELLEHLKSGWKWIVGGGYRPSECDHFGGVYTGTV